MRPGWLSLVLIITALVSLPVQASGSAPDYLIVPPAAHSLQSVDEQQSKNTSANESLYVQVVGDSPVFELEFADVRDNSGAGFDHPSQGSVRREIAVAVFERVSQLLQGEPGSARIIIDSRSPWLNQDTLAVGVPFFECVDGFQKPIIHKALRNDTHVHSHEGELLVNFDLPLSASMDAPPVGEYDLFTLLFHEIVHILGFVGFTVEPDGRPQDCGGARMLPSLASYTRDNEGHPLWEEQSGEIEFVGNPVSLPKSYQPISLDLPQEHFDDLQLATGSLRVSGHWLPDDFVERSGVLMLREPFPTGQTRRNMTPETKSILANVLDLKMNQELRGLTGSWIDTQLNGQGFTLHFISESRFAIYFFGFADNGNRQWMVGLHDGEFELGQTISIPIFEASGGRFNHTAAVNIEENPWGVLEISFLDCHSAISTLTGLDGTQEMILIPLARVDTLDCF
jgi:hypothetical protein